MKTQTQTYKITKIEQKYVSIVENNGNHGEFQLPKYKMPLEITVGTMLFMDKRGMYQLQEAK